MFDGINPNTPDRWKRSATSSTARQADFALTRRHDTAERAHPASDRRPVPQRGDDQGPDGRMARRRGHDVRPAPGVSDSSCVART